MHNRLPSTLMTATLDHLGITQYGRDFLSHLNDSRLTYNRHVDGDLVHKLSKLAVGTRR